MSITYKEFERGRFDAALCRLNGNDYICIAYTDGGDELVITDDALPMDEKEIEAFRDLYGIEYVRA